jgi:hypothetical protein
MIPGIGPDLVARANVPELCSLERAQTLGVARPHVTLAQTSGGAGGAVIREA